MQAIREANGIPWYDLGARRAPEKVEAKDGAVRPRQSWASLPESIKRDAAAGMLDGKAWFHVGREIENPGERELRRWLPLPAFPGHRTNRDKRAAVLELVRHDWRMSNREVARLAGVSHEFVRRVRAEAKTHRAKENPATVATNSHPQFLA